MWPDFNAKVTFRVGTGLKTSFWNEIWLGDVNLRILFPDLYIISLQQNDTIAQMWSPQGWDLMFRMALNDWEVGRVADLLHALNLFPGTVTEPDKPVWRLHSRGVFIVKSCYWERNTNHLLTTFWPWKLIWKIKVPLKVACFTWLVIRRAWKCYKEELLHCKIATDLWNLFVCILGVNWTMPRTTFEVLTHWQGIGKRGSKEDWWKNIPVCIWWTLWKERNGRCFEGKVSSSQEIKMRCLSFIFLSEKRFRTIGNHCGGWIETEEETKLRNHLKWARIRVQGDGSKIPKEVSIKSPGMIFVLQLWTETPARLYTGEDKGSNSSHSRGGDQNGNFKHANKGSSRPNSRDAETVNIQSPSTQEVVDTEASNWVNSHILELSKHQRVAFVGFEKETLALLMRIDERKTDLKKAKRRQLQP
ncbi:hypothetical protein H5410_009866 [Solanum commersonii]|uniref:Reverse transcriptase zinc-binding domain-containing protein n=1 Tax=Solanum commersonii TaxID=4109 RepID=A0A9J6AJ44_SOLCO|nr:hypothetical protein H5410_009866 [Solanum commersonii]